MLPDTRLPNLSERDGCASKAHETEIQYPQARQQTKCDRSQASAHRFPKPRLGSMPGRDPSLPPSSAAEENSSASHDKSTIESPNPTQTASGRLEHDAHEHRM